MAKPIGIQLYTVREACAADFSGTLRAIADIGFKGVEFAGLHGMKAADVATLIGELGMQAASAHVGLTDDPGAIAAMIEEQKSLGNTNIVTGVPWEQMRTADDCRDAGERMEKLAQALKPEGFSVGYHNHWWEFDEFEGRTGLDLLMERAPSVFAEIDVYWTAYGGKDPVAVVKQFAGRAPLLHIKDGSLEKDAPHLAVGEGKMDIPAIVNAADPETTQWLLLELDSCATDMMEAVRRSYQYMTANGLAEGNK